MNPDILWLNTLSGSFDRHPSSELDYGIEHVNSYDGSIHWESDSTEYEPVMSPINRIKYLNEYGPQPLLGDMINKVGGRQDDWPPPTRNGYMNCNGILRRFLNGKRFEKIYILVHAMGFDEVGTSIGNDDLFVYSYSTEPTQMELYLSSDQSGSIAELNRSNKSMGTELKIPVDKSGLLYVFFQIFADLNKVDFNKLDHVGMEHYYSNARKMLNTSEEIPLIDRVPIEQLSMLNENDKEEKMDFHSDGLSEQSKTSSSKDEYYAQLQNSLEMLDTTEIKKMINDVDTKGTIENIGIEEASRGFAELVNALVHSKKVAKQFVLEELDAAIQGNEHAQEFAINSGFERHEFKGAMGNSFPEVDGPNGPQQALLALVLSLLPDMDMVVKMRILMVDTIMRKWRLGRYS